MFENIVFLNEGDNTYRSSKGDINRRFKLGNGGSLSDFEGAKKRKGLVNKVGTGNYSIASKNAVKDTDDGRSYYPHRMTIPGSVHNIRNTENPGYYVDERHSDGSVAVYSAPRTKDQKRASDADGRRLKGALKDIDNLPKGKYSYEDKARALDANLRHRRHLDKINGNLKKENKQPKNESMIFEPISFLND